MTNDNSPIALEGLPFVTAGSAVSIVLVLGGFRISALCMLAVTIFIVFFFRNPRRRTPVVANGVIAPADGVVIYLGRAYNEQLQTEMMKISIFMSVFNVHVNRGPITGRILDRFHIRGKFLDVRDERATFENEQLGLVIEGEAGHRVVCVQVAGLIARRIVCYLEKGDAMTCGDIYGLIRFGSRLDVYLPPETDVRVAMGEKTAAGETLLGILS